VSSLYLPKACITRAPKKNIGSGLTWINAEEQRAHQDRCRAFVAAEVARWAKVAQKAGFKME
jgi:hypothetical protein